MQRIMEPSSLPESQAYLAAIEELTQELERAITAVATGALAELEVSLVRQQIGSARLARLKPRYQASSSDPLSSRVEAASAALSTVTRHYSRLVKHFAETARIFAGMFRGYGGPAGVNPGLARSRGAWSCEL